jgi:lipid-A-disaccharide synthase
MKKIMVSAGEVSGDIHAAYLIKALKSLDPHLTFFGIGSERLKAEGVKIFFDITARATVGLLEALPNLPYFYFTFKKMVALMRQERPDLLLLVDSQGLNMPLAIEAKKLGIKTAYYIPPQEWLWGNRRNLKKVADNIDLIIAIFEKEYQSYKQAGGKVVYFGHPLVDMVKPSLSKADALSLFFGSPEDTYPTISLFPGSRKHEIENLLPVLLKAASLIKQKLLHARFLISVASLGTMKHVFPLVGDYGPKAIVDQSYNILSVSDIALCTSGTINLEASLLGIPNLMIYKLSPLTYFIGKHILKVDKKIPFFSMPNLLLNSPVIPELTMKAANPQRIAAEALAILNNPQRAAEMRAAFSLLKEKLGQPGVISRCAKEILML